MYDKFKIQEAYERIKERDNLDEGMIQDIKNLKNLYKRWKTFEADIDNTHKELMKILNIKDFQKKIDALLLLKKNIDRKMQTVGPTEKPYYQEFSNEIQSSVDRWREFKGK